MPFFSGKTGHNEQRLPEGKTLKQVQLPLDHALTGPEQPPCHFFQAKQATKNSACRRGNPPSRSSNPGTTRRRALSSLHAMFFRKNRPPCSGPAGGENPKTGPERPALGFFLASFPCEGRGLCLVRERGQCSRTRCNHALRIAHSCAGAYATRLHYC